MAENRKHAGEPGRENAEAVLAREAERALAEGGRRNDAKTRRRPRPRRGQRYSVTRIDFVTVGSLAGNLPEELISCFADEQRHVLIVEVDDFRYVQFLVTEDNKLITEAASNVNQHPDHLLSYDQQATLVDIGFAEPVHGNPNQPNFHLNAQGLEAVVPAAVAAARVLREVYWLSPDNTVKIRRFHTLPDGFDEGDPEEVRGLV